MHHEDLSIQMLDRLLDVNNLRPKLLEHGIDETDIVFIKELIAGPIDPETGLPSRRPQEKAWPYSGRSEAKGFLYEIVANKENGRGKASHKYRQDFLSKGIKCCIFTENVPRWKK